MKVYLTDEEVRNLLSIQDYESVILNYLHIASFLAYKVASRNYNREHQELYAVAQHAVVEGVHRMGSDHPEPFRFIHKTVSGSLKKFCKRAHLVVIPDYAPDPSFVQYMEEIVGASESTEDGDEAVGVQINHGFYSDPDYKKIAEDELISHKFILPVERDILIRRLEGKTIEEVARECRLSPVNVQRTLERMKSKVYSILNGEY